MIVFLCLCISDELCVRCTVIHGYTCVYINTVVFPVETLRSNQCVQAIRLSMAIKRDAAHTSTSCIQNPGSLADHCGGCAALCSLCCVSRGIILQQTPHPSFPRWLKVRACLFLVTEQYKELAFLLYEVIGGMYWFSR